MSIRPIASVVIAALLLTGTAFSAPKKSEYGTQAQKASAALTAADAQNIALEDAALSQDQVTGLHIRYDWDDGVPEWNIAFCYGDWEYEYTIHAETGQILDRDKEYDPPKLPTPTVEKPASTEPAPTEPKPTKPAPTEPETTKPVPTEPEPTKPASTEPKPTKPETTKPVPTEPKPTKPETTKPVPTEPKATKPEATKPVSTKPETTTAPKVSYITAEEAKAVALQDAGLKESEIRDLEVELDKDRGTVHYDVDFEKDNKDYDYEIDALTGEILRVQKPSAEKPTEPPVTTAAPVETTAPQKETVPTIAPETGYITAEEAKNVALQDAGLKESEVRELEVELDRDDGKVYYDVDFEKSGYDYSYEIDAATGQILNREKDRDD